MSNFWTIKSFLPGMLERNRGHIVSISSSAGLFGVSRLAPYCASKFAVTGLTESLYCELFNMKKLATISNPKGIFISCVHPYFVSTPLAKGAQRGSTIKSYSPEEAVDSIVDGVLRNKRMLLLPQALGVLLFQKSILAGDTGLHMAEVVKVHNAFDNFEGRGWK
ncbi:Epidermal retinol dehydrogenase 2 [Oopsacas minuta]|uniref:Epidermal retinol dehydrogenase 2 n=1 Tax=Oopsacas minuta TaxID=111878 RepID=A0AAV7JMX9_9METZ|nr:Epidermal retinol dehydrogenase 2 [Oopsacas minuta]